MGFLVDQAIRLRRTHWDNAQQLSDELYAMFLDAGPIVIDSPLQVVHDGPGPAITIIHNTDDPDAAPPIVEVPISTRGGSNQFPPSTAPGKSPKPGDPRQFPPTNNPGQTPAKGGSSVRTVRAIGVERQDFMGTIVSGSGASYVIDIEDNLRDGIGEDGLGDAPAQGSSSYSLNAPSQVTATCRQIASDATIAAGTFIDTVIRSRRVETTRIIIAGQNGAAAKVHTTKRVVSEEWTFQVAVWL